MRSRTKVDVDTGKVLRRPTTHTTACGKVGYTSRKLAKAAEARWRKQGENVRAYHCPKCHCHHLGHPPCEPRQIPSGDDEAETDRGRAA